MADAIRDVLIRLKIQLDNAKLPPLDTTEFRNSARQAQADLQQSVAVQAARSGEKPGNQRDRAIELAAKDEIKWKKEAERIDRESAERQRKATEDQRRRQEEMARERRQWLEQADKDAERFAAAEERRQRKAFETARQNRPQAVQVAQGNPLAIDTSKGGVPRPGHVINTESYLQAGDAYKSAAEGAFTLARGVMLLSAANEDDLAKMAKRLAVYQGYFDVTKGGFEVVKGTIAGTKALAIAHSTAAGAAAIQSGATGALGVSMIAARGAALSLWTALTGPVGLALLGTTAAVGVGYVAWNQYSGAAERAAEKLRRAAEVERKANQDRIDSLRALTDVQRENMAVAQRLAQSEVMRMHEAGAADLGFMEKSLALQEAQRKHRLDAVNAIISGTDKTTGATDFRGQALGFDFHGTKRQNAGDRFAEEAKSTERFLELVKRAQKELSTVEKIKRFKDIAPTWKVGEQKEQAADRLKRLQEAESTELQKHLATHESIRERMAEQIKFSQDTVALLGEELKRVQDLRAAHIAAGQAAVLAMRNVKAEGLSDAEKFGRKAPWEQQQIKSLAERYAQSGGDFKKAGFSQYEIDQLDQSGLAKSAVQRHFINQGKAGGIDEIRAKLGSDNVTAQEELAGRGAEGQSKADIADFQQQFADAGRNSANQILARIAAERNKETAELGELLKKLGDQKELIRIVTNAIADRDAAYAEAQRRLNDKANATQALAEATNQSIKNSAMSRRQGGL